jgi:DNA-binding transcriptional MerR regulator
VADTFAEIPDRDVFKASEVCDIAKLQPYVLRSWEKEFPGLGAVRTPGGTRFYRKSDVEQVLRIRQLVFGEGLTLAGARRRIEDHGAAPDVVEDLPVFVDDEARDTLKEIKRELRSLLDMLEDGRNVAPAKAAIADAEGQGSLLDDEPRAAWPPPKTAGRKRRAPGKVAAGGEASEG